MPGLYKDEGIVLKTIKLGEADRIVTLFLRGHGKVRAVAKGIRKTKSRFGGRLEPFTQVQLLIYRGRNLDTITAADIMTSFDSVRTDYERLASAAAIAELVEKISPDRERAISVYELLLAALGALAKDGGRSVVPAFAVKLLSVSGYHPQLQACAGCGSSHGLVAFSAALGGVACEACRREDRGAAPMSPELLAVLSRLFVSDFGHRADAGAVIEITHLLRAYAEYHLERPLRSIGFLATI
jgi:DNA repair protein RecO (recombination protein O)